MSKSFEEIMGNMPQLPTGLRLPTGSRVSKVEAKPRRFNPGWRKPNEPEGERHFISFIPKWRNKKTWAMVHLYDQRKDENCAWLYQRLGPNVRIIIHGHPSDEPCFTPDGCFEYSEGKFEF